jgi:hypothetical protein
MGQMVRQRKYNEFWATIDSTIEVYRDAIDTLLRVLTDDQLDEVLKSRYCTDEDDES